MEFHQRMTALSTATDAGLVARCRDGDDDAWEELVRRFSRYVLAIAQPPEAWVLTAARLPATRRAIEQIAALAGADATFRSQTLEDLEGALARAGLEASPALVEHLRDRL